MQGCTTHWGRTPIEATVFQIPVSSNRMDDIQQKETTKMKRMISVVAISMVSAGVAAQPDMAGRAAPDKKSVSFYQVGPPAQNTGGPGLQGLDGRKSGTVAAYNYSDANKNSGITWNEASFLDYIKDPKARIPGTKMVFAGIKNETEAKNLWAHLKQYDAEGKTK